MGEEGLFAAELHQHFAAGGARQQRRDDLEIERLDARAEAAADERLHHADPRLVHFEAARQHQVQVVGDLRHALHRQPAGARVVFGERRVRLDLPMVDLGAAEASPRAPDRLRRSPGRDIAELVMDLALDIAGLVVVQHAWRRARALSAACNRPAVRAPPVDQVQRALGGLGVDRRPPPPPARRDSARARAPADIRSWRSAARHRCSAQSSPVTTATTPASARAGTRADRSRHGAQGCGGCARPARRQARSAV